ncbi:MAG: hypothetical protein OXN17_20665 [Candidatus Poribacteria bacterium]|nr:hypothetical protein [Candidatus Poribacteria bacterium]MDE0506077.1 hypothetical protein [Candidatus Poribacteria bacterium]
MKSPRESPPKAILPFWIGDFSVIAWLGILCVPCTLIAIEPIGVIGQPYPEHHAFLSNEALLRAVPTRIQIFQPRTGEVIDEFGKRSPSSDVVFSPTAEHLAILNYSPDSKTTNAHVWDVSVREKISEWRIPARIRVSAFNPVQPLFAASLNDEIHLWNWQTGEHAGKMLGERRPWFEGNLRVGTYRYARSPGDHDSVFSPDGRFLIVVSMRPDIELWNVETRRLEGHFEGHEANWIDCVAISPDGTRMASFAEGTDYVNVWDFNTRDLLWKKRIGIGRTTGMVFSPDSKSLYVSNETGVLHALGSLARPGEPYWEGWDDSVRVWDVKSGQLIDTFSTEFHDLNAIKLSPDEKIALLHYRDAVVIWDIVAKQPLNVWVDFPSGIVDLSPDGQTVVSVSRYFVKTWDVASQQMRLLVSADGGLFREFAISPDGQKLAVGRDPSIEVYDLHTGKIETRFPYHHGHSDIAFSASGKWIAADGDRGKIRVFDIEKPERILIAAPDGGNSLTRKRGITFSENDQYLAAVDTDGGVLLWKREGGNFVFRQLWIVPEPFSSYKASLHIRRDGSVTLAAPNPEHLQIWTLMPGGSQLVATLDTEPPVRFRSDGRYLFTNQNNNIQTWDVQTYTLIEHPPIPDYFAISRNGTVLLSRNAGRIEVWDGRALLPVEARDKQIVEWGQVKQNRLLQNYPNPFTPETWIPFQLANENAVTIRIYAPAGEVVRVIPVGMLPAGDYSSRSQAVYWDGCNAMGESVGSGIYLYTKNAANFLATRKMLVRK